MSTIHNPFYKSDPGFSRLYVFGSGGSGREISWLAEQSWNDKVEVIFLVDQQKYLSVQVNGITVRLVEDVLAEHGDRFVVAVGNGQLRRRAVTACLGNGLRPTSLIHPRAEMSGFVEIGNGSVICAGAIVTTNVVIGEHVHVNLGCTISHDVRVGEYTTLSPGVHISGHVQIGKDVFIGTGANIINGSAGDPLVIGDGSVIAAGACVTRSVESGSMVAGVPAVRKR